MGWEVTPSEGVQIVSPESKNTDIVFPENNTTQDITYTIKYVDSSGKSGTTNLTVKKCNSPGPTPPEPGEFAIPVTTTFKIVNTGTSSVNFDSVINISLANPTNIDGIKYYWGNRTTDLNCNCYSGPHNRTGHINLKTGRVEPSSSPNIENVTLQAGAYTSYTFTFIDDTATGTPMCVGSCDSEKVIVYNKGIGNRYPVNESRNIQIYKGSNTVFEYKLDPNTPFTEGGTYIINVG